VGSAVIRSLALLGKRPAQDPSGWILQAMDLADHTARPVESVSEFERLVAAVECCTALGISIPAPVSQALVPAILRYRHPDGGFGSRGSTLIETSHAAAILAALGYDVNSLGLEPFIRRCYRENGGYCRSLYGGSPTLECTWRALESLALVQSIFSPGPDQHKPEGPQ
jgi:hypothetical protein